MERSPEAIALVFEERTLSYAELNAQANRLAHFLIGRGIGPEDLVALALPRSIEMVVGLLGILKAGAVTCLWTRIILQSGWPSCSMTPGQSAY